MIRMAARTAVDDAELRPSECWCCGSVDDPVRMVHLGNHPEVGWQHRPIIAGSLRWIGKRLP